MSMSGITWLRATDPPDALPPTQFALLEPNGLLAVGGALTPEWLVHAYLRGIFPWYSDGQPILWWTPDPRSVLFPEEFHVSRSLARTLRKAGYETRTDSAFESVVAGCAAPRRGESGTWITRAMHDSYVELHRRGLAHSIETWCAGRLVGGLYGVALGGVFFAESMYYLERDASKVAVARLVDECRERGIVLIDCQMATRHLQSLGARQLPRLEFEALLARHARPAPRLWRT